MVVVALLRVAATNLLHQTQQAVRMPRSTSVNIPSGNAPTIRFHSALASASSHVGGLGTPAFGCGSLRFSRLPPRLPSSIFRTVGFGGGPRMIQTLITGPPRSGTTYLATVLAAAGHDFGTGHDVSPSQIGIGGRPGQGMENRALHLANNSLATKLHRFQLATAVAESDGAKLRALVAELPPFVKDVQFLWVWPIWRLAGVMPEQIILLRRSPEAVAASLAYHRIQCDAHEASKRADVLASTIPGVRVVEFPRCARDEPYWKAQMGDLAPYSVADDVFRSEWVRF